MKRAAAAAGVVVAIGGAATAGTAWAQMTLPGKFAVSQSGAATYAIPLQVPPGVAGLEPKLALTYSSQAGNGMLGPGWSLTGLSAITRCPQTAAQDGPNWVGGINYAADRFCLDGQRLVAIADPAGPASGTPGAYGADQTYYSTERESFSRVQSVGYFGLGNLGGPATFIVKSANGLTMEFGTTSDSRIAATTFLGVRVWALSKVTDAAGNYMTVSYSTPDMSKGQHYPARIDYTGNAGSTPALLPTKSIFFDYETDRTDKETSYQAGAVTTMVNKLRAIRTTTSAGAVPVLTYRFAYELFPVSYLDGNSSRLATISACDASGTCLLPTVAAYAGTTTFEDKPLGTGGQLGYFPGYSAASSQPFHLIGDFNGDGKADLMYWNNAAWVVLTRGNDGWTANTFGKGSALGYWDGYNTTASQKFHFVGDFNGDGKSDFMYWDSSTPGGWRVLLSNGTGWDDQLWGKGSGLGYWNGYNTTSSQPFQFTGDFNGDGKTDFMYWDSSAQGGWRVLLSTGSGWVDQLWGKGSGLGYYASYASRSQPFHFTGDFNGDGKTDFMYWDRDGSKWRVLLSTGSGWFEPAWDKGTARGYWSGYGNPTSQQFHFTGDFNGDGKTDFMYWDDTTWQVMFSTGTGWQAEAFGKGDGLGYWGNQALPTTQSFQFIGDFNGDGKTDFMYWEENLGWKALLSTGHGWRPFLLGTGGATGYWPPAPTSTAPTQFQFVGEFSGDGRDDVLYWDNAQWRLLSRSGTHLLQSITSKGYPPDLTITYGTPAQLLGNRYTQSVPAVSPQVAIAPTWPVVTDVDASNGRGGVNRTSYWYDSAVVEVSTGRGFSGFNYLQSQDVATGLVTRNYWRRDFPFAGLVYQTTKGTALDNWASLGTTWNQYVFDNFAGDCLLRPGARYFVYASLVDSLGNKDITATGAPGAGLAGSRATREMDSYGNPTRIVTQVLGPDNAISGFNTVVTNSYVNDTAGWRLGRLITSTTVSATDAPFVADPVTGCISGNVGTGGDASGHKRTIQPVRPGTASSL
jgi:hypothetical protein